MIKSNSFRLVFDKNNVFVKKGKLWNDVPVTLRTKGYHGPTIELKMKHPQPRRNGEIEKFRILGKLILIQLPFRKAFQIVYK